MNLLREIEGLRGENLASAVIRLLLLRSQDVRDVLLELISDRSRQGIVFSESKFVCKKEVPTKDGDRGDGRIDLYVELDDAIIGIENKFNAQFQPGQPMKYLGLLEQASAENRSARLFLVILAPEKRENTPEVQELLNGEKKDVVIFLPWERVHKRLRDLRGEVDPSTWAIIDFFADYVHDITAFIPDFQRLIPHFTNRFEAKGTDTQRMLVGRLWSKFPASGTQLSQGETWVGYYFLGRKAWYGFLSKSRFLEPIEGEAAFVVGVESGLDVKGLNPSLFMPIQTDDSSMDRWWRVSLDATWGESEAWDKALRPFWNLAAEDA